MCSQFIAKIERIPHLRNPFRLFRLITSSLADDVANTVTDQNLNSDTWRKSLVVRHVYQRAGDTVGQFVGVGWVYFFEHRNLLVHRKKTPRLQGPSRSSTVKRTAPHVEPLPVKWTVK